MKVMLEVLNGDNGCVRIGTNGLPDTLIATEEAQVVDAIGVRHRLSTHQGIACPQGAVPVPGRF
jgi:hypothetical protein